MEKGLLWEEGQADVLQFGFMCWHVPTSDENFSWIQQSVFCCKHQMDLLVILTT